MVGFSEGFVLELYKGRGAQGGVVEKGQDGRHLIPNNVAPLWSFMFGLKVFLLKFESPLTGCNAYSEVVFQGTFTVPKWALRAVLRRVNNVQVSLGMASSGEKLSIPCLEGSRSSKPMQRHSPWDIVWGRESALPGGVRNEGLPLPLLKSGIT